MRLYNLGKLVRYLWDEVLRSVIETTTTAKKKNI